MTPTIYTAQAADHVNLQDDYYARGWQKFKEVDDVANEHVIEALADTSPDLGRHVVEFGFDDVYSRPGLTLREHETATVVVLTALGNAAPQLRVHIVADLNVGLTREEIIGAILQMALYTGLPTVSNDMFIAKEVFVAHDTESAAATSGSMRREVSN